MLRNPKDLWDILRGVLHVNWVIMGINSTPSITWTKIIEPMVFVEYFNEGIVFLLGCGMAMQYPSTFQQIWYGAQGFLIYLERGIAHALNNYRHERYPFDSLNQNNSTHGVYRIPPWGYCFPSRFWNGYAIPLLVSIHLLWNPKDFLYTLKKVLHIWIG